MAKACVPGLGSSVSRGVAPPDNRKKIEKWPPRALLHPVVIARRLKITAIMLQEVTQQGSQMATSAKIIKNTS